MTTTMTVDPNVMVRLQNEGTKLSQLEASAATIPVTTPEEAARATEIIRTVKARWSELEEDRKSVSGPAYQIQRTVNGWFRGPLGALERIEQTLKGKLAAFTMTQRRAQEATMQATAAAIAANAAPPAMLAPAREPEGANVREVWDYRVVDLDKVPRDFCSPDPLKIRGHIGPRRHPGFPPAPVAGIEFFLAPVVTVRK